MTEQDYDNVEDAEFEEILEDNREEAADLDPYQDWTGRSYRKIILISIPILALLFIGITLIVSGGDKEPNNSNRPPVTGPSGVTGSNKKDPDSNPKKKSNSNPNKNNSNSDSDNKNPKDPAKGAQPKPKKKKESLSPVDKIAKMLTEQTPPEKLRNNSQALADYIHRKTGYRTTTDMNIKQKNIVSVTSLGYFGRVSLFFTDSKGNTEIETVQVWEKESRDLGN